MPDKIFAFCARAQNVGGLSDLLAPGGQMVVLGASDDQIIANIRQHESKPKAEVVLFRETEWNAPELPSTKPDDMASVMRQVRAGMHEVLRKYGFDDYALVNLLFDFPFLSNETGLVIFLIDAANATKTPAIERVLADGPDAQRAIRALINTVTDADVLKVILDYPVVRKPGFVDELRSRMIALAITQDLPQHHKQAMYQRIGLLESGLKAFGADGLALLGEADKGKPARTASVPLSSASKKKLWYVLAGVVALAVILGAILALVGGSNDTTKDKAQAPAISADDIDQDGVLNSQDLCPQEAGDAAHEGCPAFAPYTITTSSPIRGAAWNPDGMSLLVTTQGGNYFIYRAQTGSESMSGSSGKYVAWNEDGTQLHYVSSYTLQNGAGARITLPYEAYGVAWSPDETRVVSWPDSNAWPPYIWDTTTGQLLATLELDTPQAPPKFDGVSWSPDGTRVLTVSMYNPSYVWDAATGDPLFTLCYEGCWLGEWTPDPTRIVTLSSGTAAITLWDSQTGEIVHSLDLSEMSYYIDFPQWSPDGSRLVTSIENGALVWDAAAGTEPLILPHDGWVYSATWSPDGSKILTAAGDGAVRLWDATTGDLLQVMQHDDAVMGATWNADGTQILAWSRDGIVRVWDPATGTPIVQHEWPEHKWSGWHPQDNIVYSIIDDSTVSVWSTDTPQ